MSDWMVKAGRSAYEPGGHEPSEGAAFQGVVVGVNTRAEKATVSFFGGEKQADVLHPYIGVDSWIRIMPDSGSPVRAAVHGDTKQVAMVEYAKGPNDVRMESYEEGTGSTYRPLKQGEIELQSSGLAKLHLSERGNIDMQAGPSWITLLNEKMQIEQMAATHRRALPWRDGADAMSHEERFGVVVRPGLVTPAAERTVDVAGAPATEYFRALYTPLTTVKDQQLVVHHEGNVLDNQGLPVAGGPAGLPLRAKSAWRTDAGEELLVEVDNVGNVGLTLPQSAIAGMTLQSTFGLKINSTGVPALTRVYVDGILVANHVHATAFGPTGLPVNAGV